MRNILAVLSLALMLAGCAQGGTVMLTGEKPKIVKPTSEIELVIEKPQRAYKVLAMVTASASTKNQLFQATSYAETNALEQLKKQAAEAGADAVIDIKQDTIENGAVVSTTSWGQANVNGSVNGNHVSASGTGSSFGFGEMLKTHEIIFRAKAVKWTGKHE